MMIGVVDVIVSCLILVLIVMVDVMFVVVGVGYVVWCL